MVQQAGNQYILCRMYPLLFLCGKKSNCKKEYYCSLYQAFYINGIFQYFCPIYKEKGPYNLLWPIIPNPKFPLKPFIQETERNYPSFPWKIQRFKPSASILNLPSPSFLGPALVKNPMALPVK